MGGQAVQNTCCALLSIYLAAQGHDQGHTESETGPEEGRSCPRSWILVVSLALYRAGSLGSACQLGETEEMPVPGSTPVEEATVFTVEAVEKGVSLEEGKVAGTWQSTGCWWKTQRKWRWWRGRSWSRFPQGSGRESWRNRARNIQG